MKPRTTLIARLDSLTRHKLYELEGGRCWLCGAEATEVAHIIGRGNLSTRWDTAKDGNCHLLCRDCHAADHNARLVPSYRDVYVERFGSESFAAMWKRAMEIKWTPNSSLVDKLKEFGS